MPSLRDKAQGGFLCTFSTRTSATAAGFAKSSQLSRPRPGQAVRSVRAGGMDRPSRLKSRPVGCWASPLAFDLIAPYQRMKSWCELSVEIPSWCPESHTEQRPGKNGGGGGGFGKNFLKLK